MQNLEKRISALEVGQPSKEPLTIIRCIVAPGNLHPAYNHISADDGQVWTRLPGETEEAFTDRASNEAPRNQWGIACITMKEEVHHANH